MGRSLSDLAKRDIDLGLPTSFQHYSLPVLAESGFHTLARMPRSLRIVLESVLRNCDGRRVSEDQVRELANWAPNAARKSEVPFTVGRVVLNCAAGIPLLGDLTAIRGAMHELGHPAATVGPKVQVDMVLDHTLTVDYHASPEAMPLNMALDIQRNEERYQFVKWAMQAYDGIRLFPPGSGILHQLNLEYLAPGLLFKDGVCFPDTLVGTDSHSCMIAGLGVVGWGVGGIEAETAMLGHPVFLQMPDVVGVHVRGWLAEGVTATDLVLHVTQMLRQARVVGQFVEFFGKGVEQLSIPDRATVSNMAPEYGATIGYFPVDEQTCRYLRQTGRPEEQVRALEVYFRKQELFGAPERDEIDYSRVIELNLDDVTPCLAGPKRPQDRVPLQRMKESFLAALQSPPTNDGYGAIAPLDTASDDLHPRHGDVVIAAITSCTNTSNPGVMVAAGLVAKRAVDRGLRPKPWVKTSLTPGSQVVGRYLLASGLQTYLDALGFNVVGYSCATCVGASGPIDPALETSIMDNDVVACAVLSGNRNFESRIHPAVRASFLASPPLVIAFALAGRVDIDLTTDPLGHDQAGNPVYLADLWPTSQEIADALLFAVGPALYRDTFAQDPTDNNADWAAIPFPSGDIYPWNETSTYIKEPPFLAPALRRSVLQGFVGARPLVLLGNSVTTDHISPIGTIQPNSPAGLYLSKHGVCSSDFNNYGARRMNHAIMVRGAFSNTRLKNKMTPGVEGGLTLHLPSGERMSIFDAAAQYQQEGVPLVIIAGEEYGNGSARDWAAKATRLLGVRAVIAASFERIHRSNLIGMGVLPCQMQDGLTSTDLQLDGSETFDLTGFDETIEPGQMLTLTIHRTNGGTASVPVRLRVDTRAELSYLSCGGIMPFILNELVNTAIVP